MSATIVGPSIESIQRLADILLRGPRDPKGLRGELYREYRRFCDDVGIKAVDPPFVGVGFENKRERIVVLMQGQLDISTQSLEDALKREVDWPVRTMVSGAIIPAARPAMGGDSVGRGVSGGATGTLGCAVVKSKTNELCLISCMHVLTDVGAPRIGGDVWQPGARNGGCSTDRIGSLSDYCPVKLGGFERNRIDAALAVVDGPGTLNPGIRNLGRVQGWNTSPDFGTPLKKKGSQTGVRTGRLNITELTIQLQFGSGLALFDGQLGIVGDNNDFAREGDSGALVLDEKSRGTGLVFAVASGIPLAFANPIEPILQYFTVDAAQ